MRENGGREYKLSNMTNYFCITVIAAKLKFKFLIGRYQKE